MKELTISIDSLQKGKSADSKGIKAEEKKGADEEATIMIHEIFNLMITQDSMASSSWTLVIAVINKKGDSTNLENYTPICVLPQLYQLLATQFCLCRTQAGDVLARGPAVWRRERHLRNFWRHEHFSINMATVTKLHHSSQRKVVPYVDVATQTLDPSDI